MSSTFFGLAAAAAAAFLPLVSAQTFTACNPTTNTSCPQDPGLVVASSYSVDFKTGASSLANWTTTANSVDFTAQGAEFTINNRGEAPTIQTDFYLFFGEVEVKMKSSQGIGIISSIVLESDDLDEVDWEFIGGDNAYAQSNYFGKGNTTTYDRMIQYDVSTPNDEFHIYKVTWSEQSLIWSIDGTQVRTLNYGDAVGGKNFPQTPMNVRIGIWAGGDKANAPGTIEWAGGQTDYSKGPFTMVVDSVTITNTKPACKYEYGDMTGSYQSIKLLNDDCVANNTDSVKSSSINSASPTASSTTTGPAGEQAVNPSLVIGYNSSAPGNATAVAPVVTMVTTDYTTICPVTQTAVNSGSTTLITTSTTSTVTTVVPSTIVSPIASQPTSAPAVVTMVTTDYTTICPVTQTAVISGSTTLITTSTISTVSTVVPSTIVSPIASQPASAPAVVVTMVTTAYTTVCPVTETSVISGSTTLVTTSTTSTVSTVTPSTIVSPVASNSASAPAVVTMVTTAYTTVCPVTLTTVVSGSTTLVTTSTTSTVSTVTASTIIPLTTVSPVASQPASAPATSSLTTSSLTTLTTAYPTVYPITQISVNSGSTTLITTSATSTVSTVTVSTVVPATAVSPVASQPASAPASSILMTLTTAYPTVYPVTQTSVNSGSTTLITTSATSTVSTVIVSTVIPATAVSPAESQPASTPASNVPTTASIQPFVSPNATIPVSPQDTTLGLISTLTNLATVTQAKPSSVISSGIVTAPGISAPYGTGSFSYGPAATQNSTMYGTQTNPSGPQFTGAANAKAISGGALAAVLGAAILLF